MNRCYFEMIYQYKCNNGVTLYCATATGVEYYCPLPISDDSLCAINPCKTKKEAERIARLKNEFYSSIDKLATSGSIEKNGGLIS